MSTSDLSRGKYPQCLKMGCAVSKSFHSHVVTYITFRRYIGVGNRSVTIQGKPRTTNNWIHRESLHPLLKKQAYQAMEMKHFSWIHRKGPGEKWNISCHEHVYNQYALKHDVTVYST
jgi:hypothetical protein